MTERCIILGRNGRIGQALSRFVDGLSSMSEVEIDRAIYSAWKDEKDVMQSLSSLGFGDGDKIFCAFGIIDPTEEVDLINRVNIELPTVISKAALSLGAHPVTLGTVMEDVIPFEHQNPYVKSKSVLKERAKGQWLHLKLHTIFGGAEPTDFMFMGQLLFSLQNNEPFLMSHGKQHREYHHVDDLASAVFEISSIEVSGTFDVSSGESKLLAEIAKAIFSHYDKSHLLKIGEIPAPEKEVYEPAFAAQPLLKHTRFRECIPALIEWLDRYLI